MIKKIVFLLLTVAVAGTMICTSAVNSRSYAKVKRNHTPKQGMARVLLGLPDTNDDSNPSYREEGPSKSRSFAFVAVIATGPVPVSLNSARVATISQCCPFYYNLYDIFIPPRSRV